jgi:hypothetical protein
MFSIGVDPGWSSFGISILNRETGEIHKNSYVPKDYITIKGFVDELNSWIVDRVKGIDEVDVFIERFVAYSGVQSSASEDILMLIGGLVLYFSNTFSIPVMVRALDWKVKLCHFLVKNKQISNPYSNFDKRYSFWAAEQLSNIKLSSNHEADAICISFLTKEILNNGIKSK